jgi:hypothetical protein
MVLIGLAPLIVVGLVVIFLLREPILFVIAIAFVVALVVFAVLRQKSLSRQLYGSGSGDWMSRTGFYVGPFDGSGLPDAASFERLHSRAGHPPQVRLVVTSDALSFGPAGHSGSPEILPFRSLRTVDLIEGTHPRKFLITPPVAAQRGQVVLTTSDGRVAQFSGIPVEGVRVALEARGATIEEAKN